jgi:hypothetical protein
MGKLFITATVLSFIFLFSYCSSSKKAAKTAVITYDASVMSVIAEKCTPCHIPDKGGRVKPLNTYEAVRADIDEIIRRISLNPDEKGFMPFKHDKLSDSTIAVFKQWKDDGLREK